MIIKDKYIITEHFNITEIGTTIDVRVNDEWLLLTYDNNHKLVEKDKWKLNNFASVKGMPGESIQGTYKTHKKMC